MDAAIDAHEPLEAAFRAAYCGPTVFSPLIITLSQAALLSWSKRRRRPRMGFKGKMKPNAAPIASMSISSMKSALPPAPKISKPVRRRCQTVGLTAKSKGYSFPALLRAGGGREQRHAG
eukprot:scaffold46044_cov53-Phaeocystis_antarctica.AAC.2